MSKKVSLNLCWIMGTAAMVESAPTWAKRHDNSQRTIDLEASVGAMIGLGIGFEFKDVVLPCGHPFKGARLDLFVGPFALSIAVTSSYKKHEAFHEAFVEDSDEEARKAMDEIKSKLQDMADHLGVPVKTVIDQLPEPLRSDVWLHMEAQPDIPEPTATQINAALEAIRTGRAGQ